jgi:hypothetical protein
MPNTDDRTRWHRVVSDPRGAGIYAAITHVMQRVAVTVIAQDNNGDMRLVAHETVDDDDHAISVVRARARAEGVPADKIHITGLRRS